MQFCEKMLNIRKKSIFNDWSVSENQFNIVLYIKIYTIKNVCCWKKNIDLSSVKYGNVEHTWLRQINVINVEHTWLRQINVINVEHTWLRQINVINVEHTWLRQINVINDINGAAIENTNKCFFILGRSNPLCNRNDTKPKAAGAWNY